MAAWGIIAAGCAVVAAAYGAVEYAGSKNSVEKARAFPRSDGSIEQCVETEAREAVGDANNDDHEDIAYVKTRALSVDVYVRQGFGHKNFSEPNKIAEIPKHLPLAKIMVAAYDDGFNSIAFCGEKGNQLVVSVNAGLLTTAVYHIAFDGQYAPKLVSLK